MDEDIYLTLYCNDCENINCKIYPLGSYTPIDYKHGCTRRVSEELCAKFIHYTEEVLPFRYINPIPPKEWEQIYETLEEVYSMPIGCKLNKQGKAVRM